VQYHVPLLLRNQGEDGRDIAETSAMPTLISAPV
jgi:hypothetical protein